MCRRHLRTGHALKAVAILIVVALIAACNEKTVQPTDPVASFTITPGSGSTDTDFVFDATSSSDPDHPVSLLEVRWDWESGGDWDIPWTTDKTAVHRFANEGTKAIRMEVRDLDGNVDGAFKVLEVRLNQAPETTIESWNVSNVSFSGVDVDIQWSGTDADGDVVGFLVSWDGSADQYVTSTDSTFSTTAGREIVLRVAAQDAEGRVDPTPAELRLAPPLPTVQSEADLVQMLALAYRARLVSVFLSLLANDFDNRAEYLFITDSATPEFWGYTEEVRIHQRMFEPQNTPAGQTPVPAEYWLTAISITLTQNTPFDERHDLYESPENPTGLPTDKWKAMEAIYSANVLFDTQGNLDYQVNGRQAFVVIEDRTKQIGDAGKFLLLLWNDLGNILSGKQVSNANDKTSWSEIKSLYN